MPPHPTRRRSWQWLHFIMPVVLLSTHPTATLATKLYTSAGTSFWFARLDHTLTSLCQGTFAVILINPDDQREADVTLKHPHSGDFKSLRVAPGDQFVQELECREPAVQGGPAAGEAGDATPPPETKERRTRISSAPVYNIQSSLPIQVYAADRSSNPRVISMLLPSNLLETTYRLIDVTYAPNPQTLDTGRSEVNTLAPAAISNLIARSNSFGILALQDDTELYVRNDATQESTAAYQLSQGQAFLYHPPASPAAPSDSDRDKEEDKSITGWHVVANRPVAVFVGMHEEGKHNIRTLSYGQLMPESVLGTTYLLCPAQAQQQDCSDTDRRFDARCQATPTTFRYVATQDGTTLTILTGSRNAREDDIFSSGSGSTSLHEAVHMRVAGDSYELQTTEPHQVMANKPIYVFQSVPGNSPSLLPVPSVDQLLRPDDFSKSFKYRVAVQDDNSSLTFLHPSRSTVFLNDNPVSPSAENPMNEKTSCRLAGQWQGVEYCCTQVSSIARGMYAFSSDDVVGVSVAGTSTKPKTKKATYANDPTKETKYYTYSGGMSLQSASAQCSAGGPYKRKLFRLPGNYLLKGNATCDDGSDPRSIAWRSSEKGVEFVETDQPMTRVHIRRFGVYTLCLDVVCGGAEYTSSPATCCTTFELNEEECNAGGPYSLQADTLPARVDLEGEAARCPDDTKPIIQWSSRDETVEVLVSDDTHGSIQVGRYGSYLICMTARCGQSDLLSSQCCSRIQLDKPGTKAEESPSDKPMTSFEPTSWLVPSPAPYAEVIQESPTSHATKPSRRDDPPTKPPHRSSGDKRSQNDSEPNRKEDRNEAGFFPSRPRNIFFRGLDG